MFVHYTTLRQHLKILKIDFFMLCSNPPCSNEYKLFMYNIAHNPSLSDFWFVDKTNKDKLVMKLSGAVTNSIWTKKAVCTLYVYHYKPRFLETDSFLCKSSHTYPSFAFSDFQRPWILKSLSNIPNLHAAIALQNANYVTQNV